MFFTIYFAMTGLHGIHVLVGVFVFIWLLIRSIKGHFSPDYFGPIDYAPWQLNITTTTVMASRTSRRSRR
jgi:heme/copper-type cytochrome/quinol oxidase subunit 3